jgi:prevent-host-death family protein
VKVITSREFNQDVSQAKRAARLGPVFVTDRGKPTHVLIGIEDWRRLSGEKENIIDLLAMPDADADPELGRGDSWGRRI